MRAKKAYISSSTSCTYVEDYFQQVSIVYNTVAVNIEVWVCATLHEQHSNQVGVVDTPISVSISEYRSANAIQNICLR